ncbi:MAG: sensor histidine kinase [Sphingosinicella sp.]|nr:sensor histidine kinase [Sphingosinicella sp.]
MSGDEGDVPTTWIQPIGLIVNELVTNASKHGSGKSIVSYRVKGSLHELSVCDEGDGLPAGFDPANSKGLGMKVVTSLAKQLGGSMTTGPNPAGKGSCLKVDFSQVARTPATLPDPAR